MLFRSRATLPELPEAARSRLMTTLGIGEASAELIASDRDTTVFFDRTLAAVGDAYPAPLIANWLIAELLPLTAERTWPDVVSCIPPRRAAALLQLIAAGTISGKIAKTVFEAMLASAEEPSAIVQRLGLVQISDEGAIAALIEQVLQQNAGQLAQYLNGKDKLFGFFVGQIMKASQGKMNPDLVNKILSDKLAQRRG